MTGGYRERVQEKQGWRPVEVEGEVDFAGNNQRSLRKKTWDTVKVGEWSMWKEEGGQK